MDTQVVGHYVRWVVAQHGRVELQCRPRFVASKAAVLPSESAMFQQRFGGQQLRVFVA
jgi:hypothetical protein